MLLKKLRSKTFVIFQKPLLAEIFFRVNRTWLEKAEEIFHGVAFTKQI